MTPNTNITSTFIDATVSVLGVVSIADETRTSHNACRTSAGLVTWVITRENSSEREACEIFYLEQEMAALVLLPSEGGFTIASSEFA